MPSDGWLPQQTYNTLQAKGLEVLSRYFDLTKLDDEELLATEYSFMVPIVGTWDEDLEEPHILAGSVDRLAVGYDRRNETVKVDDHKGAATPDCARVMGTAAWPADAQEPDGRLRSHPPASCLGPAVPPRGRTPRAET